MAAFAVSGSCTGSGDSAPSPVESAPAVDGASVFTRDRLGAEAGCSICHSMTRDRSTSGPSLAGIGTRAATRVTRVGAEDYLRQSILYPDAAFAPGWGPGMPAFGRALTDAEVQALVTYLLTLE